MGELIADIYDDAMKEADRIEAAAEALWLQQVEYPMKELEEAKDRYWRVVAPYTAQHDAEFRRAEKLRETAHANMMAAMKVHDAEHAQFVNALLSAGSEKGMRAVAEARMENSDAE